MTKKAFYFLLGLVIVANATGLFTEVFLADSSLYAGISKSFVESGNYFDIYVEGKDWLDKPHFPFWIAALSFKVLGISPFAYKLPSFLFFLMALFYTKQLAFKLYNKQTSYLATLMLGSSFHILISNGDTRAEGILLGAIIGAVYHLYSLTKLWSIKHLLLCALFSAIAIMTKGVFVLIIIYVGVFTHLLIKRKFDELFNFKWVLLLVLTFLLVIPELYALYSQFDLHPEKIVFGKTNVSGIKFFLWDSQFGRFFNSGPIKGSGNPIFFLHSFVWSYAPWAILAYLALLHQVKNSIKRIEQAEWINFFGFAFMFLIFSISQFQLPHYTNILFPFVSILAANILIKIRIGKTAKLINAVLVIKSISFLIMLLYIEVFYQPERGVPFIVALFFILLLVLVIGLHLANQFNFAFKHAFLAFIAVLISVVYLNTRFYPDVLNYQSGMDASKFINLHYPEKKLIVTHKDWSVWFYCNNQVERVRLFSDLNFDEESILFANENFKNKLDKADAEYRIVKSFEHFHITKLKYKFMNKKTRHKMLTKTYLIELL